MNTNDYFREVDKDSLEKFEDQIQYDNMRHRLTNELKIINERVIEEKECPEQLLTVETPKRRPDTEGVQRENTFEKAHKTSKDFLPDDGKNFKEPMSPDVNIDRKGLV
jgi:hypothetical protein